MTAAPEAPAVDTGGGGSDLFGEIGSLLSGTPDTPEEPQAAAVAPDADAEAMPDAATPAAEAAPAEAAPVEAAPADGSFAATPDGSGFIVPRDALNGFTGAKQYADAVMAKFPTPADANDAFEASSDFRAMRADFMTGKPEKLADVMKFWAGKFVENDPLTANQMQASFTKLAQQMPEFLKSVDPQAHQSFVQQIVGGVIGDRVWESAYKAASGDPNAIYEIQQAHYAATGKYWTDDPSLQVHFGVRGVNTPAQPQPQDGQKTYAQVEMERLAEAKRAFEGDRSQIVEQSFKTFEKASLEGPKWQQYGTELDRALEPVKKAYEASGHGEVFAAIRDKVNRDLIKKLESTPDFARNHTSEREAIESMYRSAIASGNRNPEMKTYVTRYHTDFMQRVRAYLPSIAQPYINKATAAAVAQKQAKPPGSPQSPTQPRAANGQYVPQANTSIFDDIGAIWNQAR